MDGRASGAVLTPPPPLRRPSRQESRWLIPAAAAAATALLVTGVSVAVSGRFARAERPAADPSPAAVVPWVDVPAAFETSPAGTSDPRDELAASIEIPGTLVAGDVVRYTVRLENPTGKPIPLDPCPAYEQGMGLVRDGYRLNCANATDVPAGGGETFEMRLRIPQSAVPGPARVTWLLATGGAEAGAVRADAPVVIENPRYETPAEPEGCITEAKEPPCGPGMVQGREYPLVAYVHCELRDLFADGRSWRPAAGPVGDGNGNPPAGWGNPVDLGIVTLTAPDTLVYESSTGDRVSLRPEGPDDPDLEMCA